MDFNVYIYIYMTTYVCIHSSQSYHIHNNDNNNDSNKNDLHVESCSYQSGKLISSTRMQPVLRNDGNATTRRWGAPAGRVNRPGKARTWGRNEGVASRNPLFHMVYHVIFRTCWNLLCCRVQCDCVVFQLSYEEHTKCSSHIRFPKIGVPPNHQF